MIEVGWLGDPTSNDDDYTTTFDGQNDVLNTFYGEWGLRATQKDDGGHRCDARHPSQTTDLGSCGVPPGHEGPHVWLLYGWTHVSMTRKSSVTV